MNSVIFNKQNGCYTGFQIRFDLSKISSFMKKTFYFIDSKDLDNNISI